MSPLLIDTNVLCVVAVGATGQANLSKHKRTRAYSSQDYETISAVCGMFSRIIVCPHVLAETSNLVRQAGEPLRYEAGAALRHFCLAVEEREISSRMGMSRAEYLRLGLTDAVMLALMETGATLLSDDLDLCLAAQGNGYPVINYNHLRDGGITLDDIRDGVL